MKTIYEHDIGVDGAKGGVYLSGGMVEVKMAYPVVKLVDPIMATLDPLKEKLKAIIPGNWEDPLVDGAFASIKAEIVALLSE